MSIPHASIPRAFGQFVDDAAIFPPGLMPIEQAVPAHAEHLRSAHAGLVGPFIVDLARLDGLDALVDPAAHRDGLGISVVVPSPGQVPAVLELVAASAHLRLEALEVKIDADRDDVEDLASVAGDIGVYVELPRPSHPRWPSLLEQVVAGGLRAKFRTGGTEAAAFPSEDDVARWIVDAVTAGVPFKCTAGLHHAVRHRAEATGFEHHGYLNILWATALARAGATCDQVRSAVAEKDADTIVQALGEAVLDTRNSFVSYGSCSIIEPLDDLTDLGLIPEGDHR